MKCDRSARLGEIMARHVICVQPDHSVEELIALLLEHGLGGVPVVDANHKLVGIVTESDVLRGGWEPQTWEVGGGENNSFHVEQVPRAVVGELMTPFVFSLFTDAEVASAAGLMAYEGVHRLAVVAKDGELVGMVTSLDIMRWIADELGYQERDHALHEAPPKGAVMIVDDDFDLAYGYETVIREQGYPVVIATNGRDAMVRLESEALPKLIILDLNMPVRDGRWLRRELLRDPRKAQIPVVVLSGDAYGAAEIPSLKVDGYLTKPITLDQLLDTVEHYCGN
jgi:CBS domain-containing protein/CheY-like chemotaxis protein